LESRESDNSRELHREGKALRAGGFLSELKLRPPEERRRGRISRRRFGGAASSAPTGYCYGKASRDESGFADGWRKKAGRLKAARLKTKLKAARLKAAAT